MSKITRLKQKWREHRETDPSCLSFLAYCINYCLFKICRVSRNSYLTFTASHPHLDPGRVTAAVYITGGLGDCIIHRRIIDRIAALCPNVDVILFCPVVKQGKWVFGNDPCIKAVLPLEIFHFYSENYCDASLILNTFAVFLEERFHADKIRRLAPALLEMYASSQKKRGAYEIFIERHPTLDGAFARQIVSRGYNRHTFLAYMLGIEPPPFELDLATDNGTAEKLSVRFPRYVTVNTGFDAFFVIAGRTATKCWPEEYWTKFVALLKAKYPGLGVIQVGNKTGLHVDGADCDLSGKTTLEECAGILKKSLLHFDIEGGLVHVCASIGTRCVTLFGPTSPDYFGYPQNIKLRDSQCPDCWWSTERWMECCPRRYPRPECMYRLTPEKVLAAAAEVLDGQKA